ncbi:hypothetical protein B0A48_16573 [Cryoendolithus antarcticus]|uniref:Uncharacterized protein n=1 Tax=Cryoendolithus antarcticus TaxID=1507870 RepID=A0A1V8SE26_9PEZI|nr:hypothetical protein B0A48_16573 [Cryoendolithus antarcticus]
MSQARKDARTPYQDPLMAVLEPALKVGAFSGAAGFLVGGTAGIVRSATPSLFATASAIQCTFLGTTYWASRGFVLQAWSTPGLQSSNDCIKASALAGGLSGGLTGLLFRGRSNAIPGTLVMALLAGAGQGTANWWQSPKAVVAETEKPKPSWTWASLLPMKHMTNEEYAEILREKLLKVDVEISILDDKMAALKTQQAYGSAESETPHNAAVLLPKE